MKIPAKFIGLTISIFFISALPAFAANTPLVPCDGTTASPCDWGAFILLMHNVMDFLIFKIATPLAGLSFAIAGFMMITAGGNETQVKKARGIFSAVAIGYVIALAAWLIVYMIVSALSGSGFDITQFLGTP